MPSQKETCLRGLDLGDQVAHAAPNKASTWRSAGSVRPIPNINVTETSIRDHGRSQAFFYARPSDARSATPSKTPPGPRTRSVYGVALSARNPRGDFGSLPATGTSATSPITKIFRIADGQIGEAWVHLDTLSLYSLFGILPAPGGAYGPFNDNVVGPYLNSPIS
jgi:hypothetical protein